MDEMKALWAWLICFKRPWNARVAWLTAAGMGAYRCPCGRCDLPTFPARYTTADIPSEEERTRGLDVP